MARILLVSDNINIQTLTQTTLLEHEFIVSTDIVNIIDTLKVENPDIIMLDSDIKSLDLKTLYREMKRFEVMIMLIMGEKEFSPDILAGAHLFVTVPINQTHLKSTITSGLRAKKAFVKLSKSNKELANSLYQLNVLYNTSSQLAGRLNREQLIDIMNDGIDKALNSDISCTLSFKDSQTPILVIHSTNKLSPRLIEALKLRAMLNYKNSGIDKSELINIDDIQVEENARYTINEYDFEILNYNKLLAYISVDDRCYGYSEIFRKKEFTSDDSKCFHTLVNQVTLPLKSAILYQEITEKNKKLAKLERLKSEFISIVSHELKTPLTSIKNSLDIVFSGKAGDITDTMTNFLGMAKRNVKKLSRIINDLLDMSKIEAGKMDYNFKLCSAVPVINDVQNNLSSLSRQKGVSIEIDVEEDVPLVYIDTDRVEQILTNLVSNAIKFSPEDSVIKISASVVDVKDVQADECFKPMIDNLSGEYLKISVKDNGIGIEKNDLIHVFDKFEQIENSLSREVGGSGLGLSIAKQLVTAHKGVIWCDSVVNKGSMFNFIIPVMNDKNRFLSNNKYLLREAELNKNELFNISVKSKQKELFDIINEDDFWKKYDRRDFCYAIVDDIYNLNISVLFENKDLFKQFECDLKELLLQSEKYEKCDIMYSNEVVGVSDEKSINC